MRICSSLLHSPFIAVNFTAIINETINNFKNPHNNKDRRDGILREVNERLNLHLDSSEQPVEWNPSLSPLVFILV